MGWHCCTWGTAGARRVLRESCPEHPEACAVFVKYDISSTEFIYIIRVQHLPLVRDVHKWWAND